MVLDSAPTLRTRQREQLLLQRLGLRRRRAEEVPHPDPARVQPQQLGRQRAGAQGHRGDPQPAPQPWGKSCGGGGGAKTSSTGLNEHIHVDVLCSCVIPICRHEYDWDEENVHILKVCPFD